MALTSALIYLGIGGVVLSAFLMLHYRSIRKEGRLKDELSALLHPERMRLGARLVDKMLVPLLAALCIVVGWPIALLVVAKQKLASPPEKALSDPVEFSPSLQDLVQRLALPDLEAREIVEDPLCAVPPVPFGHLNGAWTALASKARGHDEFWSFASTWQNRWGSKESLEGYALVRQGKVEAHMLTSRVVWDRR